MANEFNLERATSRLWHALRAVAEQEAGVVLPLLVPGRVKIGMTIDAYVDDRPIVAVVAGELVVGPRHLMATASIAEAEHVLALALDQVSSSRGAAWLMDLPRHVRECGSLPSVAGGSLRVAQLLLRDVSTGQPTLSAAAVRFDRTVVQ